MRYVLVKLHVCESKLYLLLQHQLVTVALA